VVEWCSGQEGARPLDHVTTRQLSFPPYSFWETRAGAGSPVVLIHGLGGSAEWWKHNLDALAREHTVAAIDLVGFGRNRLFLRRSHLPLQFEEVASLLARWIESEFDEPVHLVGNSMGGHIAIHVAARRPDLVRSLTLVNATGIPFALDPRAHVVNLALPPGLMSLARLIARDLFRAGPLSFSIALARLLRNDARPLLRTLRMPVLLLWGEHDPLVPLAYAEQMREAIAGARLVVLPGAAHVPMWENPAAFNDALLAFLRQADQRPHDASARGVFGWGIAGWTYGMAYRQSGHGCDVVLVHGLGMSSAYFDRFARALHDRGVDAIAPDLPGFGESMNAPAASPATHARQLAAWADALKLRNKVWSGHSTGCDAVAQLASQRPDLVRDAVYLAPVWQRPAWRLIAGLLADAFREPPALFGYVLRAYWRTGLWRWLGTFRRHLAASCEPERAKVIVGRRDPLVVHEDVTNVDGAHAMHFSRPDATADAWRTLVAWPH
jgi:pimeloyl-ACP methyl ester carboxylesterase